MALKKVSIDQVKFESGDKVEGFLLSVGITELPGFKVGDPPSAVPKLIFQKTDGSRFSVLLGKTAVDEVVFLTPKVWTVVEKLKAVKTRGGFNAVPYSMSQDTDKVLQTA